MDKEIAITLVIIGAVCGALLLYWISKLFQKIVLWLRFKKARSGEVRAEKLLKRNGFKIIGKEVSSKIKVRADTEIFEAYIRVDFVVEKDGYTYIAEVKTGEDATSILDSSTRRQLLEYSFVFKPDGILLVDMDEGKIKEIEFLGGAV